jgi:hypothetical protein
VDACNEGKSVFMTDECSLWWSSGAAGIGESIAAISIYLDIVGDLFQFTAFPQQIAIEHNFDIDIF